MSLLPLRKMAVRFGLIEEEMKSYKRKRGRKSFFTPEGKVALAFLKMYTGLSAPKLKEYPLSDILWHSYKSEESVEELQAY